jgi:hypothetical protein
MVGKCHHAAYRRTETEGTNAKLDDSKTKTSQQEEKPNHARATSLAAANRGWMSKKHPLLRTSGKYFFLTSPFIEPDRFLAPVVALAIAIVAVAIIAIGSAISAFVAVAVGPFVVAVIAHPMLVAMGVFPLVVLEFEAGAAVAVVTAGALTVAIAVLVTVLAGLVVPGVVIVVIIAPSDTAEGRG